jgi:hypothetical protein
VTERRNDDERLAALFDGRVDDRQRQELLAHLAASDDDYEVFTHAALVLQKLEEEERAVAASAPAGEPRARAGDLPAPPSTRSRGWRRSARWASLAAGIAALALAAVWVSRDRASAAAAPVRLAAAVDASGRGLPNGWQGPERFGPVRGPGTSTPSTREERAAEAARAGVMLVDLAVAVRGRDTAAIQWRARQAASRLHPGIGHGTPLLRIAEHPGAPRDSLARLVNEATDRYAARMDADALRLGAWSEAALLATQQQDAAFFHTAVSREMLRRAERLTRDDAPARAALDQVRAATTGEAPDWAPLEAALRRLQIALGT